MFDKIARTLVLFGAFSLPLASMAADSSHVPRLPQAGLPLILIQSSEGGDSSAPSYPENPSDEPTADPSVDAVDITPDLTAEIVTELQGGIGFCGKLSNQNLLIDCLSDQYAAAANLMPQTAGYAKARAALIKASNKLHRLAVANAAPGKAAVTPRAGARRAHRPLTPVANAAAVNAAARDIIRDTNLLLLRSGEGSSQRRAAYTEVAAVVNSTKVLLRST